MSRASEHDHQDMNSDQLEALWDDLLSRQPERVRAAYKLLDRPSRQSVRTHLEHMVSEGGWLPDQRTSARIALQALHAHLDQEEK